MPGEDDSYLCDDGKVRTWAEMCDGVDPELLPRNVDDAEDLLLVFGATPLW